MFVLKSDGRKERFDKEKIVRTCLRAHASEKMAREIADYIEKNTKEGMTTHAVYRMVIDELDRRKSKSSIFLTLRDAVADIGPEQFELYAKKILESNGYKVRWNQIIQGKVIEHQVDLVAEIGGKKFLVECKRHFNPHRFCGLEVCLQVQARLEDIIDGFHAGRNSDNFSGAWIFTNSKFSEHAKKYAHGKNFRMTGWRYEGDIALDSLIEKNKMYPVTILKTDIVVKRKLLNANILTIQDALENEKRLLKKGMKDVVTQARSLVI